MRKTFGPPRERPRPKPRPKGIVVKKLIEAIRNRRQEKIFSILEQSAVQTKQFKAPVILYMHFEKIARKISGEI